MNPSETKQISIIRTAPYDYHLKGMSLYQSFNAVAKREIEVSIKRSAGSYFKNNLPKSIYKSDRVYCSPRKRSVQTAQFITDSPQILDELIEVKFKMEDFISEVKFYDEKGTPNVQKARKSFVKALVNSNLEESYESVMIRIESLLTEISQNKAKKISVFSHGFFMKIIEAYIKDKNIKNNPQKLLKYFDGSAETFKFCEGFVLDFENGEFKFNSYIRNKEGNFSVRG